MEAKETFKVLITGCSSDAYWYHNKIGETLEVSHYSPSNYKTINGELISKSDCHVIEPVWKVMKDAEETGRGVEVWYTGSKTWKGAPIFWRHKGIYRLAPEPEQPEYEPYSYEDRDTLRGWWVKRKDEKGGEVQIIGLSHDCVYAGTDYALGYKELFDNFLTAIDGRPVGKLI